MCSALSAEGFRLNHVFSLELTLNLNKHILDELLWEKVEAIVSLPLFGYK